MAAHDAVESMPIFRGIRTERRMGPRAVVEAQISADGGASLGDAGIGAQIDFLVLDRSPEPLDEDVVAPGALAVHADGNLGILQHLGEVDAGELRSLIRIEDLRLAMAAERVFESLDAEVGG